MWRSMDPSPYACMLASAHLLLLVEPQRVEQADPSEDEAGRARVGAERPRQQLRLQVLQALGQQVLHVVLVQDGQHAEDGALAAVSTQLGLKQQQSLLLGLKQQQSMLFGLKQSLLPLGC